MTEDKDPADTMESTDWNPDSHGSMADFASHDEDVETVPYEED